LIEKTLFDRDFAIVQVDADTVEIMGPTRSARQRALPTITDPKDLPVHERVISYLFTFKYCDAQNMQQIVGRSLTPPRPYTSFLAVQGINAVWLTERSSVVRELIATMEQMDVPDAKTKR
jgi:hypothetical protein